MVTLRDISAGVASININLDGTTYVWTVGALDGVADVQAYLEAHADDYRSDIRAALAMGRQLEIVTPPTLTEAISAKLAAVQAEKCRVRDGCFLVDGVLFDSDQAARTSYLELENELSADAAYTTPWKASAGFWVTMDATLYASVKASGRTHVAACFAWQAARDAELAAIQAAVVAGTMTDADAITAVDAISASYEAV
ncbi:hypothetical protein K9F62_17070 [Desulfovibrio sp. JY]|nr:hypothetical protein K9F62_17070 [Desulfovibrio sp. JY]